jgi:hypothetical protein
MSYLDTINWDKIKTDLQKGFKQGIVAVQKGAIVAKKKAGELSDEGKRQYQLIALKTKVHSGISDLGARVYALMSARAKNPAVDAKVKDIVAQIKKFEAQIAALEKKPRGRSGKKIRKAA